MLSVGIAQSIPLQAQEIFSVVLLLLWLIFMFILIVGIIALPFLIGYVVIKFLLSDRTESQVILSFILGAAQQYAEGESGDSSKKTTTSKTSTQTSTGSDSFSKYFEDEKEEKRER